MVIIIFTLRTVLVASRLDYCLAICGLALCGAVTLINVYKVELELEVETRWVDMY